MVLRCSSNLIYLQLELVRRGFLVSRKAISRSSLSYRTGSLEDNNKGGDMLKMNNTAARDGIRQESRILMYIQALKIVVW